MDRDFKSEECHPRRRDAAADSVIGRPEILPRDVLVIAFLSVVGGLFFYIPALCQTQVQFL